MDHQGVMSASILGSGRLARGSVRTRFSQKRSNRLDAALENLYQTRLTGMRLDSPEFRKLVNLIYDCFRIRRNHKPLYVDVGDILDRISAAQHQVIFGRRGSGKSCLLIHYLNTSRPDDVLPIYILADEYKRLTYPDILIRLLVEILEALPVRARWLKWILRQEIPTRKYATELRRLLDMAEESDVVEDRKQTSTRDARVKVGQDGVGEASVSSAADSTHGRTSRFKERKVDVLERHLSDYKKAVSEAIRGSSKSRAYVLVDDFYLISRQWHPDVLDYLHRLLRDTELYLKVATIRHRTQLLRNHPQTIGVELSQDIEEITLDRTLEDLQATETYLGQMLASISKKAGIDNLMDVNFNPEALQALTLTSGGVPRDFLNIFVNAVEASVGEGKTKWLTPKYIYKGAGRLAYQTKLKNLREDANGDAEGLDRLLADLLTFCLREKKKTAFLISQEEAQTHPREHDLIQQLMDFKLIHVVELDTSAASGRPGRYEAYTLDFSLFMEPRRRNIEIVEFWKIDENRRRTGIREAPVYPLPRAGQVFDDGDRKAVPEDVLHDDEETSQPEEAPPMPPSQGSLFDR